MLFTRSRTVSGYALWLNFEWKKHKGGKWTFPRSGLGSPAGPIAGEQMVHRLQRPLASPGGLLKTQIAGLYH